MEEVADRSRLSPAIRYESLVRVSNAIGTHRDSQVLFSALASELQGVVPFDCIGAYIRDQNSNTFHKHFVHADTQAPIPSDPEIAVEESYAWWVYENQEPLVTSLETDDPRFPKLQELLKKKYGVRCVCTLPLTAAEEVNFLSVVAEQIALAFDNALHFAAAQVSQQQLSKFVHSTGPSHALYPWPRVPEKWQRTMWLAAPRWQPTFADSFPSCHPDTNQQVPQASGCGALWPR